MSQDHPVWQVYDRLRTARLNVVCLAEMLHGKKTQRFWLDLVLLVTASGGSGGLWVQQLTSTDFGLRLWTVLCSLAAVLSIVKPLLKLDKQVESLESELSNWRILDHDYQTLRDDIVIHGKFDGVLQKKFEDLRGREREIKQAFPDRTPSVKLRQSGHDRVLRELPTDTFFIPPASAASASGPAGGP